MKVIKNNKGTNACLPEAEKGMAKVEKTKINLWLDPDPYKKLKFIALEKEVTITSIINELIATYVKDK